MSLHEQDDANKVVPPDRNVDEDSVDYSAMTPSERVAMVQILTDRKYGTDQPIRKLPRHLWPVVKKRLPDPPDTKTT